MVIKSLKEGAKGYILKPISEKKLSDAISNIFPKYTKYYHIIKHNLFTL
jgi:FixJ family two-component response regulator